ncbi:MAG: acyltransferase [Aristaeellaceae bacterium]
MMKNLKLMAECVLSVPKSVFFCLRVLPLSQAIKMPVLVHYNTRLFHLYRGAVKIKGSISPAMIKLGFGGTISVLENRRNILSLERSKKESALIFEGRALLGKGFSIRNHGMLTFGSNFYANKNFRCSCAQRITFGKDVLCGWNVVVRDADGHTMIENGERKDTKGSVRIGNHV